MLQKINIYNDSWTGILFKERNKEYGAYQLRKDSDRRHLYGLLIALAIFFMAVYTPVLYNHVSPKVKATDKITDVNIISTFDRTDMKKPIEKPVIEKPEQLVRSTIKFTPPIITNEEILGDELLSTQEDLLTSGAVISTYTIQGNTSNPEAPPAEADPNPIVDNVKNDIFVSVEQMPEFPGGTSAMMSFIGNALKYPVIARENSVSGRVFISFVIDSDGSIIDAHVSRGVDSALDKEALRVVKSMPKWIPGKQNGASVKVYCTIPISFILK